MAYRDTDLDLTLAVDWPLDDDPVITWSAPVGTPDNIKVWFCTTGDFADATVIDTIAGDALTWSDAGRAKDGGDCYWWVIAYNAGDTYAGRNYGVRAAYNEFTISGKSIAAHIETVGGDIAIGATDFVEIPFPANRRIYPGDSAFRSTMRVNCGTFTPGDTTSPLPGGFQVPFLGAWIAYNHSGIPDQIAEYEVDCRDNSVRFGPPSFPDYGTEAFAETRVFSANSAIYYYFGEAGAGLGWGTYDNATTDPGYPHAAATDVSGTAKLSYRQQTTTQAGGLGSPCPPSTYCPDAVEFDGATRIGVGALSTGPDDTKATLVFTILGVPTVNGVLYISDPENQYNNFVFTQDDGSLAFEWEGKLYNKRISVRTLPLESDRNTVILTVDLETMTYACLVNGLDWSDPGGILIVGDNPDDRLSFNGLTFYIGDDTYDDFTPMVIEEFWFRLGTSLGMVDSVIPPENVAKFFNGTCPVNLGADGSLPGFGVPDVYLSRPHGASPSAFLTNRGPPDCGFCPKGAYFDGTTSILNAALAAADAPSLTNSFFFKMPKFDGLGWFGYWQGGPSSGVVQELNNALQVGIGAAGGAQAINLSTSPDHIVDSEAYHHGLITVDTSVSPRRGAIYVDGALLTSGVISTGTDPFSPEFNGNAFIIGDDADGFSKIFGAISEFWFMPGLCLLEDDDTITPENIAKFRNGRCAVDLGEDGSAPGFGVPPIYLSVREGDMAAAFLVNRGTGGDFVASAGALSLVDGPCPNDFTEQAGALIEADGSCCCVATRHRANLNVALGRYAPRAFLTEDP